MKHLSKILAVVLGGLILLVFISSSRGCGYDKLSQINKTETAKQKTIRGGGVHYGK